MSEKIIFRSYKVTIKGKVQGVSYRFNAQAVAHKLNLTGYVKNLFNGAVFAHVEGKEEEINKFIDWCYLGSRLAKVTEVEAEETDLIGFQTFEVRK
ncbi:MAG: acylphosphatase [Bacteroidota bacterium]|nr:acylphosphatase [Bacteroidota bacterium]MDP3144621.1 acylphosphatase [Bacteroidota bacterium]